MRAAAARIAWAALFLVGLAAFARVARAENLHDLAVAAQSSDSAVAADALFHLAEAEDAAGSYADALAHYRESVAKLPSLRWAPRASTRAATLAAHAEGAWRPFARLEAARRDPHFADDPANVATLARDADGFPPGPTRVEARMVCAEAWARRGDRADAERALEAVLGDPSSDPLTKRQAASALVASRLDAGDFAGAREAVRAAGPSLEPKLAKRVDLLARRRVLRAASIADVACLLALAAAAVLLAARRGRARDVGRALRGTAPLAALFGAYVAIAGGLLASGYEAGNAAPFLWLGGAVLAIVLVARAWSAAGSPAPAARAGRAALCFTATLAAAFLALDVINPQYLESFGL